MKPTANETQIGGDHYRTDSEIQVWDFIDQYDIPYLEGNVLKYVIRHRNKNGVKDLKKAKHYLQKIMERKQQKLVSFREVDFAKLRQSYGMNDSERIICVCTLTGNYPHADAELNDLISKAQEAGQCQE